MAIVHYRSDGVTPLGGLAITNEDAGSDSDTITYHAKNDGVATALNYMTLQRTVHPTLPTVRLATGVPPQDQMWGRIRIVGYDNAADPTWSVSTTDWVPVGAYGGGPLVPTIPPDCWVVLEYLSHPPGEAEVAPWTRSLVPLYDEYSQPVPIGLTREARGVLHGIGDFTRSGIIRGGAVTTGGAAVITVAGRQYLLNGVLYSQVASTHTLNQNDSAAAALASGQSYYATLSLGASGVTVTKGTKAASPTKPALPAGELFLKWVLVEYQAGGTSAIDSADITGDTIYDRYLAVAGSGLNLIFHAGQSLGGGTWRFAGGTQTLPLTDAATNYVWQLASGLFTDTTTTVPPELTAIGPLWKVVTAAGGITTITDLRTYADRTRVIEVSAALPGSPGDIGSLRIGDELLYLETVIGWTIGNGGGSAGSTKFEAKKNGTTIYTSSGTDDQRPAVAFDATTLWDEDGYHELTEFRRGDLLTWGTAANPTGGTPASGGMTFVFRVP